MVVYVQSDILCKVNLTSFLPHEKYIFKQREKLVNIQIKCFPQYPTNGRAMIENVRQI